MAQKLRWERPRGSNHPGWATKHGPIKAKNLSIPLDAFPFGKYHGADPSKVPTSYLRWVLRQAWPDQRVVDLASRLLESRGARR